MLRKFLCRILEFRYFQSYLRKMHREAAFDLTLGALVNGLDRKTAKNRVLDRIVSDSITLGDAYPVAVANDVATVPEIVFSKLDSSAELHKKFDQCVALRKSIRHASSDDQMFAQTRELRKAVAEVKGFCKAG